MKPRYFCTLAVLGIASLFLHAGISTAQPKECVKAGDSVGVYPTAPGCCAGLELIGPPAGNLGSAGTCRAAKTCMSEGESVAVRPNALPCCASLELIPPAAGILGSAGTCSRKSAALTACELKVSQIEALLASGRASTATDLAKKIKDVVRVVPDPGSVPAADAGSAR